MLQESARRSFLVVFIVTLLYLLIFGEDGVLTYVKLKRDVENTARRINSLAEENKKMRTEIDRLRNDRDYLEEIVRKKYGLIREGEKVYRLER